MLPELCSLVDVECIAFRRHQIRKHPAILLHLERVHGDFGCPPATEPGEPGEVDLVDPDRIETSARNDVRLQHPLNHGRTQGGRAEGDADHDCPDRRINFRLDEEEDGRDRRGEGERGEGEEFDVADSLHEGSVVDGRGDGGDARVCTDLLTFAWTRCAEVSLVQPIVVWFCACKCLGNSTGIDSRAL